MDPPAPVVRMGSMETVWSRESLKDPPCAVGWCDCPLFHTRVAPQQEGIPQPVTTAPLQ